MDERPVLLVVGDFSDEHICFDAVCAQFGWSLQRVPTLEHPMLKEPIPFAAGLIDMTMHDGVAQLRSARRRFPGVLWIGCSRFGSTIPWTELERLGAFYFLHRPLRSTEFVHALGFVDAVTAKRRRKAEARAFHAA